MIDAYMALVFVYYYMLSTRGMGTSACSKDNFQVQ